MNANSTQTERLLDGAANGDKRALNDLFERHQPRLLRTVAFRLDPRLRRRIDPLDIVQDVYVEALRSQAKFLRKPYVPFFLWLRGITLNVMKALHRGEFTQMRDPRREVSLQPGTLSRTGSEIIAKVVNPDTSGPRTKAIKAEMSELLQDAINHLEPHEREVLILRYWEHLTNVEVAVELGIEQSAATKRFTRAVKKLKAILGS